MLIFKTFTLGYFPSKAADAAGPTLTEKDPAAVSSPSAAEAEKETLKFHMMQILY